MSAVCFKVKDAAAAGIINCYLLKVWAIKLATNAVNTVLQVDQVSVPSGVGVVFVIM